MNIEFARKEFQDYLDSFDRENDKIKLKIVHTEGVVRCAAEIARRMNLSEEDKYLAELIALLHDITRGKKYIVPIKTWKNIFACFPCVGFKAKFHFGDNKFLTLLWFQIRCSKSCGIFQ